MIIGWIVRGVCGVNDVARRGGGGVGRCTVHNLPSPAHPSFSEDRLAHGPPRTQTSWDTGNRTPALGLFVAGAQDRRPKIARLKWMSPNCLPLSA